MPIVNAKHIALATILLAVGLAVGNTAAPAGTIENLERERAIALETLLAPDMSDKERQTNIELSRTRLVDLERMVLRDDSLKGRNTPTVRRAFQSYELTFLVHAATEKDLSVADNWLEQIGVTTHSLMSAKYGRR